jgi:hypothetical protein
VLPPNRELISDVRSSEFEELEELDALLDEADVEEAAFVVSDPAAEVEPLDEPTLLVADGVEPPAADCDTVSPPVEVDTSVSLAGLALAVADGITLPTADSICDTMFPAEVDISLPLAWA